MYLTPASLTTEPLLFWLLTLIYFYFINESSSTFVIHKTCRSISGHSRTFYIRCIEVLRKNVCSIRVATTKIMEKLIPSVSCGQVQLVRAGGWATYSFKESKIAVLCIYCSIVLIGVIDTIISVMEASSG